MLPLEKFVCDANGLRHDATAPSPWKQKYRLKLLQNLYGLKDAGATWFNHLTKELTTMGFKQGLVDPCLFFRNGIVLVIYVDDCLIFTPEKHRADAFIKELEKRFTIEDEGDITNYLGCDDLTVVIA